MDFLSTSYNPWVVLASLAIATFASYVALDLAKRVRTGDRRVATAWLIGGSVAMGSGIWCMHFIGMLAFSLPIALGYTVAPTILSWCAGVAVSGMALWIASQGRLTWRRLTGGALAMGLGICTMHYTGMAALDLAPGIVWNVTRVLASAAIAVAASAAALLIFFWLRRSGRRGTTLRQALAALVMGIAICGMHYTAMSAAAFPVGTVCLSVGDLSDTRLGLLVSGSTLVLLAMTLLTSMLDARLQGSLNRANQKLQSANEELRKRAFLDPLTGLPNRLLFEDRLMHALLRQERHADRRGGKLGVLFVDLDGFKPVNDQYGHAVGDQVLKVVAQRLRLASGDADTVARIGGDEFLVLIEDIADTSDGTLLATRLMESLARPIDGGDRPISISASIGIVIHPDQGEKGKLIAHADAAMYEAKRAGGNTCMVFEARMDAHAREQLSLQVDLRRALELGQLQLYYQPKVGGISGHIHGVEALLRWNHPQRGQVSPAVFIPLAERFNLIGAIGDWVIGEACRQMRAWADEGLRMRVAINLSMHQLREEDLVQRIDSALRRNHLEPSQLLCEITESVAMDDVRSTQRAFEGLASIGVFLSIDDFGTGYSSLSYLRQMPASQLKIDRSFVFDLEKSKDALAIVSAVIRLAHELGLRVVAEGVETSGQRDILVQLGCDELQGFFLARPMPAEALEAWTTGRKPEGAADFAPSVLGTGCFA
jgi:diguanylate cyclase (GGDEF)-like protein